MDEWVEIVRHEAEARSAKGNRLYLAQIPSLLRRNNIDVSVIVGDRKFLDVLKSASNKQFEVLKDETRGGTWYIAPTASYVFKGVKLPESEQSGTTPQFEVVHPVESRRYLRPFWTAFIKRIPDGMRRYIKIDGAGFQDIPDDESAPDQSVEVTKSELAAADLLAGEDPLSAIQAAIEVWCRSKGFSRDRFVLKKTQPSSKGSSTPAERFVGFIERLPEPDQRRIVIPLDIVVRFLRS